MGFWVRDPETEEMIRELADRRGLSPSEVVSQAVSSYMRDDPERIRARIEAVRAIQDEIANLPKSGLKADKAFFDELSGD